MTNGSQQPERPLWLPVEEPASVPAAAGVLREGGVVVVPTDTVYGLAASVFRLQAVGRIFEIKQRPPESRVPVLLATAVDLPMIVESVPTIAWRLIDRFWPGPLTIVLPARPSAPELITRGGATIAVRVPAARSCLRLLEMVAEPIIGTSANLSGRPAATRAAGAVAQLDGGPDAVLVDDHAIRAGVSSTVVEPTNQGLMVHRVGAIGIEELRKAAGSRVQIAAPLTSRREAQ